MLSLVAAGSGGSGSGNGTFLLLGVVILLGVLLFVSNRRKRRQAQSQQQSLLVGSAVSTTSGMLGTLVRIDDKTATVRVSEGVELEFIRRAIVPRSALLPESADEAQTTHDDGNETEPAGTDGAFSLEKDSSDNWGSDSPRGGRDDHDDSRPEA